MGGATMRLASLRTARCATGSSSSSSSQPFWSGPRPPRPIRAYATSTNPYPFPAHLTNPTPYEILHLSRNATQAEIKARYYDLVKQLHPDRRRALQTGKGKQKAPSCEDSDPDPAAEEFRQVVKAYELLSHAKKRHAFDQYGYGWDSRSSSYSNPNGYGTFGSANRSEWEELQRRRRASGTSFNQRTYNWWATHDQTGWQRSTPSDEEFFFSRHTHAHERNHNGAPRYTANSHFIACIAVVTWSLAIWQINRLSGKAAQASVAADKRHLDAVSSYQEAKELANSLEGRRRFETLRARAREGRVLDQIEAQRTAALQARHDQKVPPTHYLPPPTPPS